METIGTFASGIAHNFNNIVGAILGYTEMADARVKSGSRPAANLAEIRRAGERARELVEQILTFGRRGEGRRERDLRQDAGRGNQVAARRIAAFRMSSSRSARRLRDGRRDRPSRAQLQQVILNLCNNAAQAMDEPGLIELSIGRRDLATPLRIGHSELGPGRFAVISVADPGPGMDEATLERIFEPFFTTRPGRQRSRAGNGSGDRRATWRRRRRAERAGCRNALRHLAAIELGPMNRCRLSTAPDPALRGVGETVLVLETDRRRLLRL